MQSHTINNRHAESLWDNARDSVRHALEHFSSLSTDGEADSTHNKKWIVLSVHHAAETVAYMLLKEFDENNIAFIKNGNHYYPGMERALKALLHKNSAFPLTQYEKDILGFFRKLSAMRNKLMHGRIPDSMDVSIAAMAIVGISKISKKRCNETADDLYTQYPSIQRDVAESIRGQKLNEYIQFVQNYVTEISDKEWVPQCPSCAGHTTLHGECEACFEEISKLDCPHCGEETYIIDSFPFDQDCGECCKKVATGTQ